jgi:hypothetical protein
MGPVELLAFALFTGITLSGIAGSVLEMIAESPLSFAEPFVSRSHVAWSLTATVLAGPMMLANDAMKAWRSGDISLAVLGSCAGTSLVWALAIGIVALELAARLTTLLL